MLRDRPYSTTFNVGPCTVYNNSADNFDGGWHMYGVRLRQPKTSNDFGRRPERLPAGKIEFAARPPFPLPDMAAKHRTRGLLLVNSWRLLGGV